MSPMLFTGQVRFGAAVGQASATTPSSGWQKVEVDDLRKSGQFCRKLMRDHVVTETCFLPHWKMRQLKSVCAYVLDRLCKAHDRPHVRGRLWDVRTMYSKKGMEGTGRGVVPSRTSRVLFQPGIGGAAYHKTLP